MDKRIIVHDDLARGRYERLHFPAAVVSRGLVFVSGLIGVDDRGELIADPPGQFAALFSNLESVLTASGSSLSELIELETFHVGLREHFEDFATARDKFVPEPYPAWTAMGCTELLRPGALVELRAVALHSPAEAAEGS